MQDVSQRAPGEILFAPSPRAPRALRLSTEQGLPRPRAEVFPFFADAFQLERITPDWLHFRVLTPPPILMRPGALIDYRLRLHGIPLRWQTEITVWDPPWRFVDEQRRGPYRLWRHEHRFQEDGNQTIVTDEVDYIVPGGSWVDRWFVQRDLRQIFAYRQRVLAELFAG